MSQRYIGMVIGFLALVAMTNGCTSARKTSPRDIGLPDDAGALVDLLATSDEPAADAPVYTPSVDTPNTDPRVVGFAAARKLKSMGKRAFPVLLESLDDNRQSVAFRRVIPHDVGFACFCILQDQIESVPGVWRGYQREGPGGKRVTHPEFLTSAPIRQWYEQRKDWTLVEMQIEAVQALLAGEQEAGFSDEKQEEEITAPYLERLRKLKNSAKKDRRANKELRATR